MERFRRTVGYIVVALQVLIVFILVFEERISVPPLLQAYGRMHPLVLHLPIGLLVITLLILIFRKQLGELPETLVIFLLSLTSLTASLTTSMGLFLSFEGGYEGDALLFHKWAGVLLSFVCWALLALHRERWSKAGLVFAVVLLLVTGHFGSVMTHGDKFVLAPLASGEENAYDDSVSVFTAAIAPVLEAKCQGCHNEQKAKGKLLLTSFDNMLKGGKHGSLWVSGDPEKSLIIERISLPPDAKEHMPPKEKVQLTREEKSLIAMWIERGADAGVPLISLPGTDSLKRLAMQVMPAYDKNEGSQYAFAFADAEKLASLNIPTRSVFQLARNEPAVSVNFFLRDQYDRKNLQDLLEISEQIVSMNFSGMPVTDEDMETIAKFPNLEKLVLNNTAVQGERFDALKELKKLTSVSLSGTKTDYNGLEHLAKSPSLRQVFVWNTSLTRAEVARLQKEYPHISWEIGYVPDAAEILRLNPPMTGNDEKLLSAKDSVVLKHNLSGTVIRYTVDGSDPDSVSSLVYKAPIALTKYLALKTRAFREGWGASDVAEYVFFRKGIRPVEATLLTKPDPGYQGELISTLTNGFQGIPDFYRDPSWVGFREEPMSVLVTMPESAVVSSVTVSYARNIWALCMPPKSVVVWGGDDPHELSKLAAVIPQQPDGYLSNRTEGAVIEFAPSKFRYYKVIAAPLARLPDFRNEKKQRGWLMVDEIFFN